MSDGTSYIRTILPLKLGWAPTYSCTEAVEVGARVSVEFAHRSYIGVVESISESTDIALSRILPILHIESDLPPVTAEELSLWKFISNYYLCTVGEVYKAAYPVQKIRSEQTAASRLAKLEASLAKYDEALAKKHCERVSVRLTAERDSLSDEISSLRRAETAFPEKMPPEKPVLFSGAERYRQYLTLIARAVQDGRQVLVLTPEIAFCDRLEARLRSQFDGILYVVNSTRTLAEKRKAAACLRSGQAVIILGTRSAIFLPFRNLALVIIDEEQEYSYKQSEPAPRYNGRDTALMLACFHDAQVILGSSSPSLESIFNCHTGKYSLEVLPDKPSSTCIIDIAAEHRKNGMIGPFSRKMILAARAAGGPCVFIRGWERPEDLLASATQIFNSVDIKVMTLGEMKHQGVSDAALICVIQADALVCKDDFRSDERALQLVAMLEGLAPRILIQTEVPSRFSGIRSADDLLAERRQFGFPPYTRIVDVKAKGTGEIKQRFFLKRDAGLAARKAEIAESVPANEYIDVDPQ